MSASDTVRMLVLAALGTGVGSVVRDLAVHGFRTRLRRADLGVLAANLVACACAGAAGSGGGAWHWMFVVGFAGGLSTWSTLAVDAAGAIRARNWAWLGLHLPGAFALALAVQAAARLVEGVLDGGAS
ncbi:MAG: hypothetical protein RLZZ238_1126 [Planctomycetota bacterium]|jgi:fluoride ion exporter CrcB/FEX